MRYRYYGRKSNATFERKWRRHFEVNAAPDSGCIWLQVKVCLETLRLRLLICFILREKNSEFRLLRLQEPTENYDHEIVGSHRKKQWKKSWIYTSDGIYIQNTLLEKGDTTGPMSAEFILKDPTVEFAVLETARGGILRSDWDLELAILGF
jgi:hypothetical protein